MFLPTTKKEIKQLGWDALDVILVTGDSYIDSPFIGVAVIGKVLRHAGFRVGIIAQPDTESDQDIRRLGEPKLFWGVTGGCVDSMVANLTATGKKRQKDDYTPGGINNRRPDRATIVYANLIRKYFKNTAPIVLGGIEASLRRVAHYDFWSNRIRRSVLFDAKADFLAYGMAEKSVVELAGCLKQGKTPHDVRGLCYISKQIPEECIELPTYETCAKDKDAFANMFHLFYRNNDPIIARPLAQRQDTRFLVQNPPAFCLSGKDLDAVHDLEYERELHPFYRKQGDVRALETIRFSIATHRGCYGECNYCAIAVHQGRQVTWRSKQSILAEARQITAHSEFKGIIADVGGPTANMYGIECTRKNTKGSCTEKRCLFPKPCVKLNINHARQRSLLKDLRGISGIRKVVIASGIRHDMILADQVSGTRYLEEVVRHHVSGQLKIAPEHCQPHVLQKMGKPGSETVLKFKEMFYQLTKKEGLNQFLTYYLIAAHPGCTEKDMAVLKSFASKKLGLLPEQVQVFTPTPSTYSSLMYWTGKDPFTGEPCFVEKTIRGKERQKNIITGRGTKKRNQKRNQNRRPKNK
ncbi:MAG: YgiQ family radical SAM protein [Desulfobacteraceae bacterium]|nr:YgiQ family radical SAM protein [Desulfobacteraceae bacterium]MBC2756637.1 YgiQ family radical SAM protein [Desulfobacteraceae bacterium]